MSLAYRVFLVHPDQTLYRVPHLALTQLCAWNPEIRIPDFANQRIRFAHVYVQMQDRIPLQVKKLEGQLVRFDAQGALDMASLLDAELLTLQDLVARSACVSPNTVIDARARFSLARCLWIPTPKERQEIIDIALMRAHAKIFSLPAAANVA